MYVGICIYDLTQEQFQPTLIPFKEKNLDLEERRLQHQQQLFHAQLHSTRSVPNCSSKMSSFSRRHPTGDACAELESFTPFDPFADREVAREIAKPPPFYFESRSRLVPSPHAHVHAMLMLNSIRQERANKLGSWQGQGALRGLSLCRINDHHEQERPLLHGAAAGGGGSGC